MEEKLKPCPFCGGSAEIVFSGPKYTNGEWRGFIVAKCETCGATTKGMYYRGPEIEIPLADTVGGEKAAKSWNRRVNAEQTD